MTVLGTPYRLGSTSYIWPADILPNVRRLAPLVDDVELVLFEVEDQSNLPDTAAVAELRALAQAHHLTYTVHLPLDLALAQPQSLAKAEKVIACCRDLSPYAYVLHLDGKAIEGHPGPAALAHWQDGARRALQALVGGMVDASQLCVENLENYSPEHLIPVLEDSPASLCIDVGHLWLTGSDPVAFLDQHLERTRVIHLHGIAERDHQSLLCQGRERVERVLEFLAARHYDGVLTVEVFCREDFFPSRTLIAEIVNGHK